MASENAAAEVAEDFKLALEDMTSISRIEIMNLCQIARENTEHAYEISEVLVAHINRTAPQKKLASLYVLDAIVKNVGTPYTLYVAPKLYSTFMESYARVDQPVRRKMEEMLKTWKGPVPGSLDTKPVFPPEVVLPIETALIKVHNSMQNIQQNRKPPPPHLARPDGRNTPTPPGMNPSQAPGPYPHRPPSNVNGNTPPVPLPQQAPFQPPRPGATPTPVPPHHTTPVLQGILAGTQQPGYGTSTGVTPDVLNKDIEDLIVATRVESVQNPHDSSVQTRLKALVDLQGIVRAGNLPQDQLVLVKKQVDELAVKMRGSTPSLPPQVGSGGPQPVAPAANVAAAHISHPPAPNATPQVPTPTIPASSNPPGAQGGVTIDSLLGKGALATLLAKQAETSRNTTPTPAVPTPPPASAVPAPAAPPSASDPMALIQQLRQAGLIGSGAPAPPPVPAPAQTSSAPPPSAPSASSALASLPPVIQKALSPMKATPPADPRVISWDLDSLQIPRPFLYNSLYSDLGPPCSQCGRRFKTDEEGKKKKTAHMDWHFQVRQRMAEAEKRGQYRSHYVSKQDWIKSREEVDLVYSHEETEQTPTESAQKPPEQQYIPVPDPTSGVNTVCPICQERFENKWLDSAQEWVWLDAQMVKGRAFHASCHLEAAKDRGEAMVEGVLGKRKAEGGGDEKVKKSRG